MEADAERAVRASGEGWGVPEDGGVIGLGKVPDIEGGLRNWGGSPRNWGLPQNIESPIGRGGDGGILGSAGGGPGLIGGWSTPPSC